MNYFAVHANALGSAMTPLGNDCPTFTWNGQDIKIVPGSLKQGKKLDIGGFSMDSDLMLWVRVSDLPPGLQPTLRQTIVYLNRSFRIERVNTLPGGLMLEYECNDVSQGG